VKTTSKPTKINIFNRLPEVTNEKYLPLYENKDCYLVLYGEAGIGKSNFVDKSTSVGIHLKRHQSIPSFLLLQE